MIARRAQLVATAVAVADQVALGAAYLLAPQLVRGVGGGAVASSSSASAPVWLLAVIGPLWALAFAFFHLYDRRLLPTWRWEVARVVRAVVAAACVLGLAVLAVPAPWPSGPTLVALVVLSAPTMVLARRGSRELVLRALGPRFVLVAGWGGGVVAAAARIRREARWGLRLVGVATEAPVEVLSGVERVGGLDDLPRLVEERVVDEVVLVPGGAGPEELARLDPIVQALEERGVTVHVLLEWLSRPAAAISLDRVGPTPLLTLASGPQDTWALLARRLIESVLALGLLVALGPLLLLIAAAIKLTSPGPVLFRQTRCGLHGRPFTFLKFRSMYAGAEQLQAALAPYNEMDGPVFKMWRDPRVTLLGRWLRRTSLDELPQLWNIVRGEMSFVGPRPAVPEEVARYEPWQRRRLSVKPGLTGLWQVSGRSDLSFEGWIRLDLEYIDHRSLWEDLKIVLRTIPAVLRGRGAW
jgi:exopolysaccharide biosynthesis polyprenyl glycosylphosphotransferase